MMSGARTILLLNAVVEGLAGFGLLLAPALLTHPPFFATSAPESAHGRAFSGFLESTFGYSDLHPATAWWAEGGPGLTAFGRGIAPCALLCLALLSALEASAPSLNVLRIFCLYHIGACVCMITQPGLHTPFLLLAGWGVHAPLAAGFAYHAFIAPGGARHRGKRA